MSDIPISWMAALVMAIVIIAQHAQIRELNKKIAGLERRNSELRMGQRKTQRKRGLFR